MMRALLVVACSAVLFHACAAAPEPPPFKPVADLKQLMNGVIDPAADGIWDSTGWIITAAGEEHKRPQNDEEWLAVMNQAITLTEAGNLLMLVPRAKDDDLWMKRSRELIEAGEKAWRAAQAKDPQRVFDTGGEVYVACLNCHGDYIEEIKNPPVINR
jgi:hypothetical protein